MKILSIDTSTKNFSLAVSKDERVLRYRNIYLDKVLESSIIPAVEGILKSAKVKFADIDGFAVGLGPGSFTSLRVGLSTIKAFALSTGKPVVGISSLDVVAANVLGEDCDEICVVMDARRNLLYSCIYDQGKNGLSRKSEPMLTGLDDLLNRVHGRTFFVGDAVSLNREAIKAKYQKASTQGSSCAPLFAEEKMGMPQARKLSVLAYRRFCKKEYDDSETLVPVYLYAQDCQVHPSSSR
jgi:tRNA threonylcarbamoyladenosine biosynthesis protein TsaB